MVLILCSPLGASSRKASCHTCLLSCLRLLSEAHSVTLTCLCWVLLGAGCCRVLGALPQGHFTTWCLASRLVSRSSDNDGGVVTVSSLEDQCWWR